MAYEYSVAAHRMSNGRRVTPEMFAKPLDHSGIPLSLAEADDLPPSPQPNRCFPKDIGCLSARRKKMLADGQFVIDYDRVCQTCGVATSTLFLTYDRENRRFHEVPYCIEHYHLLRADLSNIVEDATQALKQSDQRACHWCRKPGTKPRLLCKFCGKPSFCSDECHNAFLHMNRTISHHECIVTSTQKQFLSK